jgi:hypothetical protein
MLAQLLLTFAAMPAGLSSAVPGPDTVGAARATNGSRIEVSTTFDGRGRVHAAQAQRSGDALLVHGYVSSPSPAMGDRRWVTVEALDASGNVLEKRLLRTERAHGPVVRRHHVRSRFVARIDGIPGAVSLRIHAGD